MRKLCLIYNSAPLYRKAIFQAIDKEYDCDWYFGEPKSGIKQMDLSLLRHTKYYKSYGNPNKLFWQGALISSLFSKKYQNYFILTQVRAISLWVMILLSSIFFPKKRIYGWSHGWYGREGTLRKKFDKWRISHMAGQFVYNEHSRQLMIEGGIPKNKLFVIYNSLDYDIQLRLRKKLKNTEIYIDYFGNTNPVIIFIGRLTYSKKLDLLVKALKALKDKGLSYNVTFIGDGEARKYLENIVEVEGLKSQTWFYGACYDETQNAELIYNASLCVSPGNVGLTAIHSLMFGTPVITCDDFCHQGPEFEAIKEGITGDFFKANDAFSLADKIDKWFAEHTNREQIRKECYAEIDTRWTPNNQMEIVRQNLKVE